MTVLQVLVVDDDAVDRAFVRRSLSGAGVAAVIREAGSAEDAFVEVSQHTFDCVFLDYNIPDGDGLTVLGAMRRAGCEAPVIVLTGQGDEQVAVALMKAGAADYVPKSALTPERLAQSLRYAVELARATAAAREAQTELRDAMERTRFLAEASRVLADSLDVETTLRAVARLGVLRLADLCMVLRVEDGAVQSVATHADPTRDAVARAVERWSLSRVQYPSSRLIHAIRTGRTQHLPSVSEAYLDSLTQDEEERALLRALAPSTVLVVPLVARGETLGAVTFLRGTSHPYDDPDVALAEDLVQRAAMALDNARLFALAGAARRRAEDAVARTEQLQRLTAALAGAATAMEVGDLVMRHGVLPTGAFAGAIARPLQERGEIELVTCVGYPADACMHAGRRWPSDARIPLADAMRSGEAIFVESPEAWATRYAGGYTPVASAGAAPLAAPHSASRAWAAVPLRDEGGVRGSMLWTFDAPREFGDEDRALLAAIAQQCAQALDRAHLREAERRARGEAESANRAKSDFLARMSHDLRTPLNAIGGYAQLIELGVHGPVTTEQGRAIGRIRRAQEHLLMLINDILSFARLEAGQVAVALEPVAVHGVMEELAGMVRPEAATRGLALDIQAGPPGLTVHADPARLMQVLLNLTSNALKFTERGRVGLSVTSGEDWVELCVSDSGCGIPHDWLPTIFDPFVQAHGIADEQRGGVGLGLAISRELSRLMGGDLAVQSEEGQGSTFTVRLARGGVLAAV